MTKEALAARPADPVEPLTQTFNLCIDNAITAGTLLSNVAFNIKQQDYLAAGLRKDLERCQREWDVACGYLIRARDLATPAEPPKCRECFGYGRKQIRGGAEALISEAPDPSTQR